MVIGVDLGGINMRAALIRDDKILEMKSALLFDKDSLGSTLSQLTNVIAHLMGPEVQGIGIGVPSVVDINMGIVFNVANIPSWEKVELKSILEKEFRIPVFVNNDVNCFVLGEYFFGNAGLSKAQMKSRILHERRLELAFEAQRWDDLERTGGATNVMTSLNEYKYTCEGGVPSAPIKINYNYDQNHWLMPIPSPEIDANPSLEQNPGY
jgi:hypothetical protein